MATAKRTGRMGTQEPQKGGGSGITFIAQMGLDPTDPFPEGHTLSDTWLRAI